MVSRWKEGEITASSIYKHFGISSQTFYRRVNEKYSYEADRKNPKNVINLGEAEISREDDNLVITQK